MAAVGGTARRHVASGEVPGLVALVAHGDDVHVETVGSLSLGGAPLRRDSQFRIASVTKPIAAACTLALVGRGVIELDAPVDALLPELADRRVLRRVDAELDDTVPATRPITTRDLLTFTFGFGIPVELFTGASLPIAAAERAAELGTFGPPQPDRQPPPDEWLARLGALPLLAQPGERWLYNTGASVLGVLCSRAEDAPFDEVLASTIFEPLGMGDTAMWADDPARLATAYMAGPDGSLEVWDEPTGQWSHRPAFPDGAAGLVSTADDLHRFARALLEGGAGLIPAPLVEAMTTDQLTEAQRVGEGGAILQHQGWGFGQAVVIEGDRAGAYGWTGGLGTSWLVDPVRDLVVVVLTQVLFSSPKLPPVHEALQAAAYGALG